MRRLIALRTPLQVRSTTVLLGPQNDQVYGLPAEYDAEMRCHVGHGRVHHYPGGRLPHAAERKQHQDNGVVLPRPESG